MTAEWLAGRVENEGVVLTKAEGYHIGDDICAVGQDGKIQQDISTLNCLINILMQMDSSYLIKKNSDEANSWLIFLKDHIYVEELLT